MYLVLVFSYLESPGVFPRNWLVYSSEGNKFKYFKLYVKVPSDHIINDVYS